ncbi:MAG: xylulokinase [Firmicutes bacterium]|nr:xylulokinase [Bacillota bacterium]
MKYLIGADIGTSGTKTVLFDENLNEIASSTVEYPMYQPQNGWAEQDPEDWYNAVIKTVKTVIEKSGVKGEDIKGTGLSGQMHGLVMLDKDNKVLRPSIIWCDQRTEKECKQITELVGAERLIEITANPALTGFTASKIMWVKNNEPLLYEQCRHILLPKDYVRFMLTGEYATEVSDASGTQLLDVPNRCWSDEVLNKLGIERSLLGKVYESCDVTGYVTRKIADITGLAEGTPVVGGAGDNASAAVGTGIVNEGAAFTTIGTSGVVYVHTDKPKIDKKGRVHTFCCAVPNCWHVMGVTQAAGLSLKWFKDTLFKDIISRAEKNGADPYDEINELANSSPIGANRLIYLPYLMGERTPHLDADCRGVLFGLSASHTQGDILRAVMEGVSFSLADCKDILEEMGITANDMTACGGGSASDVWAKILADCYGCDIKRLGSAQGPALGAAILAGVGAGIFKDVRSACDRFIKPDNCIKFSPENNIKYKNIHSLYKKLYTSLKADFKQLSDLS